MSMYTSKFSHIQDSKLHNTKQHFTTILICLHCPVVSALSGDTPIYGQYGHVPPKRHPFLTWAASKDPTISACTSPKDPLFKNIRSFAILSPKINKNIRFVVIFSSKIPCF